MVPLASRPARALACTQCSLRRLCLPHGLGPGELVRLETVVRRCQPVRRRSRLYSQGQAFDRLYALRSGSVKMVMSASDGSERILGFHLPGDLLGLDGLAGGRHHCTAVALDSASVCQVAVEDLNALCAESPPLHAQVQRLIGEAIVRDRETLFLLGRRRAEERLARFLLSLSERLARRGLSAMHFRLSMSRDDIGHYLGLALGTVSRLLTALDREGVVSIERRDVRIRDLGRLHRLAALEAPGTARP